jgi:hypothetical protein
MVFPQPLATLRSGERSGGACTCLVNVDPGRHVPRGLAARGRPPALQPNGHIQIADISSSASRAQLALRSGLFIYVRSAPGWGLIPSAPHSPCCHLSECGIVKHLK